MVITPSFQVGDVGSIPTIRSNWEYRIAAITTDCKSVLIRVRRFESFYSHNSSTHTANDGLSQIQFRTAGSRMLENFARWCIGSTTPFDGVRVGSNPARVTIQGNGPMARPLALGARHREGSSPSYPTILVISSFGQSISLIPRRWQVRIPHYQQYESTSFQTRKQCGLNPLRGQCSY